MVTSFPKVKPQFGQKDTATCRKTPDLMMMFSALVLAFRILRAMDLSVISKTSQPYSPNTAGLVRIEPVLQS